MLRKLHKVCHETETESHPKQFGIRAKILVNHIIPNFLFLHWIKPLFQTKNLVFLPSLESPLYPHHLPVIANLYAPFKTMTL